MISRLATTAAGLVVLLVSDAPAQLREPPALPPDAPDRRSPEELRREVLERMRAMRAWKLTEELRLDESTSAKLFPVLARYDERELDLMKERGEIVRALRTELEAPAPDHRRLTNYVDRLLANRAKVRSVEDEKIKDLRKVLASPAQQARLIILLPRIESHFHDHIRSVTDGRRRRGGHRRDPFGDVF